MVQVSRLLRALPKKQIGVQGSNIWIRGTLEYPHARKPFKVGLKRAFTFSLHQIKIEQMK